MLLYSKTITPRLRYIADFIGNEISDDNIRITTDVQEFRNYPGPRINYSVEKIADSEFRITPHKLLFEDTIFPQTIETFTHNARKAFFKTDGDFPFDIFAATFYLLSRYEEYLPHEKDMYGRYDHVNSIAYNEGFLDEPLVNYWLIDVKKAIKTKFPSFNSDYFPKDSHRIPFLPTYDIDMAWKHRHKGLLRQSAGFIRALLKGRWKELRIYFSTNAKDPYDAYGWMNKLHEENNLKPYYFFLVSDKRGKYDKNISPSNAHMQSLVREHASRYPLGIHPSWKSGDDTRQLKHEIETLSKMTGSNILSSRQHYIRFTLPGTFRLLIDNGIQFDFSVGYGGINGFRASVATPFYWYDLDRNEKTTLYLFPYCYMDANSFYEQGYTAQQAFDEMRNYYAKTKSVNGTLIMIWHNSFLGTDLLFSGWREVYEKFISQIAK